jgi:recombination protein RecT
MKDEKAIVKTEQEKAVTEEVLDKVTTMRQKGELQIPQGYSAENALKSAYLILQETVDREKHPVLQSCTKASIANCLLDMVIQGLSPAKKQCYFIAYGNKLQLSRSYMGTVAVTKRLNGVKNVVANCIFEGDEFEYKLDLNTGLKQITKHEQSFENIDPAKIKGAYAIVVMEDGQNHIEIMNINQIKKAWNQGAAKGNSGAHTNFTDEMAKKTVINRACKMYVNTSDDSDLLVEAFNNSDEKTYDESTLVTNVEYEVQEEVKTKGNSKNIDIDTLPVKEERKATTQTPSEPQQVSMSDGPGF